MNAPVTAPASETGADPGSPTMRPEDATAWADWCAQSGGFAMHGTRMVERSRKGDGEPRWCFSCRTHRDFVLVIRVPDGLSYYGPDASVRCAACDTRDADLFPGRYRIWEEG